ncbi:hypothetical protein PCYB_006260, partial [Plasmodium cynomolgi strain B]
MEMSHNTLDITKWENDVRSNFFSKQFNALNLINIIKQYPFLNAVWNIYNEFDKPVENKNDIGYSNYDNVCNRVAKDYIGTSDILKRFCVQLVRNLGCYSYNSVYYNLYKDRCAILYYWIYKSIKQHGINKDLITAIFYDYYSKLCTLERKANCFFDYTYYDKFKEPVNMIFLEIFQHNINTVIYTLNNSYGTIDYKLQRYICETVNLYNEMNKKYCLHNDPNYKRTCDALKIFKITYNGYLYEKYHNNYIIPPLDNVKNEDSLKCILQAKALEPVTTSEVNKETSSHLARVHSTSTDTSTHSTKVIDGIQVDSRLPTVFTADGTVGDGDTAGQFTILTEDNVENE